MKTVITYGTFDLFHVGHLRLLERCRSFGDRLIVGVSSDSFNAMKGKKTIVSYAHRSEILSACKYVDAVLEENCWEQKRRDIQDNMVDIFVMGDDWAGKFDDLGDICMVTYLPRTANISTTDIKSYIRKDNEDKIKNVQSTLERLTKQISEL